MAGNAKFNLFLGKKQRKWQEFKMNWWKKVFKMILKCILLSVHGTYFYEQRTYQNWKWCIMSKVAHDCLIRQVRSCFLYSKWKSYSSQMFRQAKFRAVWNCTLTHFITFFCRSSFTTRKRKNWTPCHITRCRKHQKIFIFNDNIRRGVFHRRRYIGTFRARDERVTRTFPN